MIKELECSEILSSIIICLYRKYKCFNFNLVFDVSRKLQIENELIRVTSCSTDTIKSFCNYIKLPIESDIIYLPSIYDNFINYIKRYLPDEKYVNLIDKICKEQILNEEEEHSLKKNETTYDIPDLKLPEGSTLIYRYIRGSHMYHLNTPESDIDTSAVYINPIDILLGLRKKNDDYSADEKNDNTGYDIEKFMSLLIKSNPTILESLFADESCILYEHPIMKEIKSHKEDFLTKDCLRAFLGYAYEQIAKAKGYNKLCAYPENMERKQPLDFCYTFNDYQGTEPITTWLEKRGLKQIYCGLNKMQNMNMWFGIFYDWGQHLHMEFKSFNEFMDYEAEHSNYFTQHIISEFENYCLSKPFNAAIFNKEISTYELYGEEFYNQYKPKGFHGIVKEDGKSCDVHLDSIPKGDLPITHMSYNKDGYSSHCKLYLGWQNWKKVRNQSRYTSNFGTGYDAKNMSACIRLLRMAVEIAEGKGFLLNRELAGDREYLLDVKVHKFTYEQLLEEAYNLKDKLDDLIKTCDLPEHVDNKLVNDLLIKVRKYFYSIK